MKMILHVVLITSWSSAAPMAYAQDKTDRPLAPGVSFEEKRLAVIRPGPWAFNYQTVYFSPNGRTVAYVYRNPHPSGERWQLVVGDEPGEEFGGIHGLTFSPDGNRFAYDVSLREKVGTFAVMGTKRLGTDFGVTGSVFFSPDGKTFAYSVRSGGTFDPANSVWVGGTEFMVVGEGRGEDFDEVDPPIFTPDAKTITYRAKKGGKVLYVVGSKIGEAFDEVSRYSLSPDGKTIVYVATKNGKRFVVAGDQHKGEEYEEAGGPILSPDGRTLAYNARKGGKEFIVVGDRKGEEFESVDGHVFSPDGKTVAYMAKQDGKYFAVVGGKKGEKFEHMGPIRFSPDGKSVTYQAVSDRKILVVAGNKKSEGFDLQTVEPFFGPDNRVAYAFAQVQVASGAMTGKHFIVVGEKKWECRDAVVQSIVFSRDGKSFAYVVEKDRKKAVVVGEKRGPEFDGVSGDVLFTSDGKSVVYQAFDKGKTFVVAGDKKGKEFDQLGSLTWSADGNGFAYVASYVTPTGIKQCVVLGDKQGDECDQVHTGLLLNSDGTKVAFGARKGNELWWKVINAKP